MLVLPKPIISFLTEVEQPPWAVYYESPEQLFLLALLALKGKEEVERISKDVALLSEQEKLAYKANMARQVLADQVEFDTRINSLQIFASEDLSATLDSMSPEQRDDELAFGYYFTNSFVTGTPGEIDSKFVGGQIPHPCGAAFGCLRRCAPVELRSPYQTRDPANKKTHVRWVCPS